MLSSDYLLGEKVQRKWNNSCKVNHKHEGKNKTKTEKTFISQIYLSKIVISLHAHPYLVYLD